MEMKFEIPPKLQEGLRDPKSTTSKMMGAAIIQAGAAVQREIKKNVVDGWGMNYRKGVFTGSLNKSITLRANNTTAEVGTNLVYAAIQEFGGIIRPIKAKALFIPLSEQAKKAGRRVKGKGLKNKSAGWIYGVDYAFAKQVTI